MTGFEVTRHAIELGREAWQRIKKDSTYNDWMSVGEALEIGRTECMRLAGTNEPRGRGYNVAFSQWLTANAFGDIDKGTRARLDDIMRNRPAIETWRATLAANERQQTNHPSSVWRKFQASRSAASAAAGKQGKRPSGIEAENARLKQELDRVRANGGDAFTPKDSARDIARYLFDVLSDSKLTAVLDEAKQLQAQFNAEMREGRSEAKARVLSKDR